MFYCLKWNAVGVSSCSTFLNNMRYAFLELWDTLFKIDVSDYKNLGLSDSSVVSIRVVLLGLAIGTVVGTGLSAFHRLVIGKLPRKLREAGADSPETAKTPEELGLGKNIFIRCTLRYGSSYKRVLVSEDDVFDAKTEGEDPAANASAADEKKRTPKKTTQRRYYIPHEMGATAESKFALRGSEGFSFLLSVILTTAVTVVAFALLPRILALIDSLLG